MAPNPLTMRMAPNPLGHHQERRHGLPQCHWEFHCRQSRGQCYLLLVIFGGRNFWSLKILEFGILEPGNIGAWKSWSLEFGAWELLGGFLAADGLLGF